MNKKIVALTLVLSLIFTMFLGTAQVLAAPIDDLQVTAVTSDSATQHKFRIDNISGGTIKFYWSINATSSEGWEEVNLAGGDSKTITCNDPAKQGVTLTIDSNGQSKSFRSLNEYYVNVYYKDQAGNVLETSRAVCSKNGGVSFTAAQSVQKDGETYLLNDNSYKEYTYQSEITQIVFQYQHQVKQAYTCPITYFDQDGNQIGSASMTVQPYTTGSFTAPQSYTGVNGRKYNLIAGQNGISHPYDLGMKEYTFRYQFVRDDVTYPYSIRIQYVTADSGVLLTSKSVTVQPDQTVSFDVASSYTTASGLRYDRASGQSATISHTYGSNTRAYTVKFNLAYATSPYDISVRYVDSLTGKVLQTNSVHVGLNETARFSAAASFKADGETYLIASGQSKEVVHNFGTAQRVYNVYYNSKSAGAVDSYNVSIRYFDLTSQTVIYSTTETATLGNTLSINPPQSYTANGKTYVLLSLENAAITHEFYNTQHAYVFSYYEQGDANFENAVINQTVEGNTVITAPDNTVVTITPEGTLTLTTPDNQTQILDENGDMVPLEDQPNSSESSTSSLEDPETPLANKEVSNAWVWWTTGGIVLLAAAGVMIFLIIRKRRSAHNE